MMTRVPPVSEMTTLVDLLRWRARHEPDRLAYIYLKDGVASEHQLTYAKPFTSVLGSIPKSRWLTWSSYFHDYGLIHGLIASMFLGFPRSSRNGSIIGKLFCGGLQ